MRTMTRRPRSASMVIRPPPKIPPRQLVCRLLMPALTLPLAVRTTTTQRTALMLKMKRRRPVAIRPPHPSSAGTNEFGLRWHAFCSWWSCRRLSSSCWWSFGATATTATEAAPPRMPATLCARATATRTRRPTHPLPPTHCSQQQPPPRNQQKCPSSAASTIALPTRRTPTCPAWSALATNAQSSRCSPSPSCSAERRRWTRWKSRATVSCAS
mmetsp:Transcript_12154/g.35255  ORF Transcript_12154/g.35255 Transcript_12154/m.35255 type:complete len:213 (+) Transcript_12154:1423-2061(+)